MKNKTWFIIVLVCVAAGLLLLFLPFSPFYILQKNISDDKKSISEEEQDTLDMEYDREQNEKMSQDSRFLTQADDLMISAELYGIENGNLPENVTSLGIEVSSEINYERISDKEAVVSVKLSEQSQDIMSNDDGEDDSRYELKIKIP